MFECTFEGGQTCEEELKPQVGLHPVWEIYSGNKSPIKTIDHTFKTLDGHFYAVDLNQVDTSDNTYINALVSQKFAPTEGTCVTFSYYIKGAENLKNPNYINSSLVIKKENNPLIYDINSSLWKVIGEKTPYWSSHRMTVSSTLSWQLMIGLRSLEKADGIIAIDDLNIEFNKPCPPAGKCDFEVNKCLYKIYII